MAQLVNFSNYDVLDTGTIISKKTGKPMKPWFINSRYLVIRLTSDDKEKKSFLVHRLVALTFISNPLDLPTVNHKNGDRTDNNVSNLEWATMSEQHFHSYRELGRINPCSVKGKKHKSTVSKYHNVGFDTSRGKWRACLRIDGINYQQKRFNTEEEAALHVNYLLDLYGITDRPKNVID